MLPDRRILVIHRSHVLTHFTCVPPRSSCDQRSDFPTQCASFPTSEQCMVSLLLQSSQPRGSIPPSILIWCIHSFSPFCTLLICKIKLQIMMMVNVIQKSIHMYVYIWQWNVVPFIECDLASAMSLDCFEVLYCFTLELWPLIFSMWMRTLCYFPRRQSVHAPMVSGKLPGLWAKASDLCMDPGFLYRSCAGTPSADLTSCNADAKPSCVFYSQLQYASCLP